ncbi:MAG: LacI family DNA-binding transcriptional regulator [Pseudomonadota bacterium]
MEDVARAAGVSRMTVSRALRENSPISDKTRARILAVVRELNYVPDQMAGSLTTRKSGFVAALLPSLNNLHFALTVQALTQELESAGLQILLGHTEYSAEREERLVESLLRRRPEAMVLSYDGHTPRTVELLKDIQIPVVEIWELPERSLDNAVGFSNFEAAKAMTEALIGEGFRHITFLGEVHDDWTRGAARRRGFVNAMQASGLDASRVLQYGVPPLSIETGAKAVEAVLSRFPDTECVFCVSDAAAFGVQSELLRRGIAVPGDMSVAGFGDFEVSRFASPSISTVVVDPERIGAETGRMIYRMLSDASGLPRARECIDIGVRISLRESTARAG